MKPKAFGNMTRTELIEWIDELFDFFSLWRCTRCGGFGAEGWTCACCGYDPTANNKE